MAADRVQIWLAPLLSRMRRETVVGEDGEGAGFRYEASNVQKGRGNRRERLRF